MTQAITVSDILLAVNSNNVLIATASDSSTQALMAVQASLILLKKQIDDLSAISSSPADLAPIKAVLDAQTSTLSDVIATIGQISQTAVATAPLVPSIGVPVEPGVALPTESVVSPDNADLSNSDDLPVQLSPGFGLSSTQSIDLIEDNE